MKFLSYLLLATVLATPAAIAQQAGPGSAGQASPQADPIYIYKLAGIDSEQEGEIRKLVKDFESAQRVRIKVLINLVKDMRGLQLQPSPVEDEVLDKQDEINKVTSNTATERVKLMLKIRSILTPQQKQKLVGLIKKSSEQQQEQTK